MRSRSAIPALALSALVALSPVAVFVLVGSQKIYVDEWVHVVCVAFGAAMATAAALALTLAGARQRDGRAVLVGVAFSVMASLLFLHGLATPGVWFELNGVVALTGGLTIPVGGAILALAALPAVGRPEAVPPLLRLLFVAVVCVVGLGVAALFAPSLVPSIPDPRSPAAIALLAVGLLFFGLLTLRALRTYRLTCRAGDLAVAVGTVWLGAALVPALVQDYWRLGWWLGHGVELAGIVMIALPVALDLRRGSAQSRPLVGDMSAVQLVLHEEAFLGSHVRALLVALHLKDTSTAEHTRRVALRAVEVGEELGLPPSTLRNLALGGLLHDIGKLAVPTGVLAKRDGLTDEELDLVQRHPVNGDELLRDLGGFPGSVHRLVRHHHERLDGSGYPDAILGDAIRTDTRILAVCDVYDALVSDRVYRAAWSHERAIALLRHETLFDQACVEALERIVAANGTGAPRPTVVLGGPRAGRVGGRLRAAPDTGVRTPSSLR